MTFERPMLNFTLAMVDAPTKIYQKKYIVSFISDLTMYHTFQ